MSETSFSVLTPPGQAALATVAVRGPPEAWEMVRGLFRPMAGTLPEEARVGAFWVGRFGEEGGPCPEVVLAVRGVAPSVALELHAPGGTAVVELLRELLLVRGAREAPWGQVSDLPCPGGQVGNLSPRQALALLPQALTVRTAGILLDQAAGALRGCLERADRAELEVLLRRWRQVGRRLTVPWRVVIAGAPNVGKSSLANALAGYQRSIVAPTPGTTRDVVTAQVAFDGWPVELADTAGQRTGAAVLEGAGIELARRRMEEADLCLWVLDASTAPVWPEEGLRERVRLVVNKVDLPAVWDVGAVEAMCVSAVTGAGIPELGEAIARWLVPEAPPAGTAVPFTAAQAEAIATALGLLAAGRDEAARAVLASVG